MWLKEKYLDTGLCNKEIMGYFVDAYWIKNPVTAVYNTHLANLDYLISKKAFIFDLSPWADEPPNDDPGQVVGTDLKVLKSILLSANKQVNNQKLISVAGMVPWMFKYCTGFGNLKSKHEPVPSEWKFTEIISAYNGYLDADIGLSDLANGSIFCLMPFEEKFLPNKPVKKQELKTKTYIMYNMGDYDAGSWISLAAASIWDDPGRGEIPICWGFDPDLVVRVPQTFKYFYETRSQNDYIIFGIGGAGYLNPSRLVPPRIYSDLPSGLDAWVKHNKKYCDKFGLSITGFLIEGNAAPMKLEVEKVLPLFVPDGVVSNEPFPGENPKLLSGITPMIKCAGYIDWTEVGAPAAIEKKAKAIYANLPNIESTGEPEFLAFRCILTKPSLLINLTNKLKELYPYAEYEVVDPYTFFELMKQKIRDNQ
jgi:hypothetical protein